MGLRETPLTLAVSNSAAVLVFSDSLMKKPVRVEKRTSFPFTGIRPAKRYFLVFTKKSGDEDYLGFRLISREDMVLLDEALICLPFSTASLEFTGAKGWLIPE